MIPALSNPQELSRNLVILSRPQNVVYPGLVAVITGALLHELRDGLIIYALLLCLYACAAGYNNLRDIAVDRDNDRQDNPLATGSLRKGIAKAWIGINLVLVLALQMLLPQPSSILVSVGFVLLLLAYSSRLADLQSRGYAATVVLAICYGGLPVLLVALPAHPEVGWEVAACQTVLVIPGLLAKDYKDVVGDRRHGKRTPLVRYGTASVRRTARMISAVGCLLVTGLLLWKGSWLALTSAVIGLGVLYLGTQQLHDSQTRRPGNTQLIRVPQLLLLLLTGLLVYSLR